MIYTGEMEYYKRLYSLFMENSFLPIDSRYEAGLRQTYFEKFKNSGYEKLFHEEFLDKIGISMEKMAFYNYAKFKIWQKAFSVSDESEEYLSVALDFNIYCVLIDKILDGQIDSISQKDAWRHLIWEEVRRSFEMGEIRKEENCLDILLNRMASKYRLFSQIEPEYYSYILENIHKAYESEIYMSQNCSSKWNPQDFREHIANYTDKSIKFVKACFQIASFPCTNHVQTDCCAQHIGILFWLVDDLCDIFEDLRAGFYNSVFLCEAHTCNDEESTVRKLTSNVGRYVLQMKDSLTYLKSHANNIVYDFILWELREWCENISRRLDL